MMNFLLKLCFLLGIFCLAPCVAASQVRTDKSQSSQGAVQPKPAAIESGEYTNEEFGLTFEIPNGWQVLESSLNESMKSEAKALFDDKSAAERKRFEDSVDRTTILLVAAKPFVEGEVPANVMIIKEFIPGKAVLSLRSFYDVMIKTVGTSTQVVVEEIEPLKVRRFGARLCGFFALRNEYAEGPITQRYLFFIEGRNVVVFRVNVAGEADDAIFKELLKGLRLSKK